MKGYTLIKVVIIIAIIGILTAIILASIFYSTNKVKCEEGDCEACEKIEEECRYIRNRTNCLQECYEQCKN